jgi:hypothetical protein
LTQSNTEVEVQEFGQVEKGISVQRIGKDMGKLLMK